MHWKIINKFCTDLVQNFFNNVLDNWRNYRFHIFHSKPSTIIQITTSKYASQSHFFTNCPLFLYFDTMESICFDCTINVIQIWSNCYRWLVNNLFLLKKYRPKTNRQPLAESQIRPIAHEPPTLIVMGHRLWLFWPITPKSMSKQYHFLSDKRSPLSWV